MATRGAPLAWRCTLTREHYQRNHDAVMRGWLARAAKLLEGQPDCHETGLLLWMKVRSLLFVANDAAGALDHARELVEFARRLGDPDLEALGLLDQAHALITAGRAREGSPLLDEATALAMTGATEPVDGGHGVLRHDLRLSQYRRLAAGTRSGPASRCAGVTAIRSADSPASAVCIAPRSCGCEDRWPRRSAMRTTRARSCCAWAPRYAGWAYHELGEVRRRRGDLQGARTAFGRALDVGFDPQPGLALLRLDESDPGGALAAINLSHG